MSNSLSIAASGDHDIVITRSFDATAAQIYDAHTKPELFREWMLGPDGWALTTCEIDLRVGGKYRCVWSKADTPDMGMGGTYKELRAPHLIVNSEIFDQDWTGGETLCRLELREENGQTHLTNIIQYSSAAIRDTVLTMGMEAGLGPSYDRLDAIYSA